MKRALIVTAGTLVGVAAALNYVPRPLGTHVAAFALEDSSSLEASSPPAEKSEDVSAPAPATPKAAKKATTKADAGTTATEETSTPSVGVVDSTPVLPSTGSGTSKTTSTKPKATPTPTTAKKPTPTPTKPPAQPVSKVYTGSAAVTPYGAVQVQIAVKDGRITEVGVLKYPSTDPKSKELAAKAIPILKQETIAKQSANLSNISGASFTCTGWKKSLQAALTQAGL